MEIQKPGTSDVLQFISVHSMKRTDEFVFRTGYIFFTKTCRSSLPPSLKYKNMTLTTQTTSQVDTNDFTLYMEESNFSIGESSCIIILIRNINVSSNCSIKI